MPAIPKTRSILFIWAVHGTAAGCLFALVYGYFIFPVASLRDLALIAGLFGPPAGLACGLIGGAAHGLVGGRKGAWLGGLSAAAVTPGFLAWLLDGCPRLKWEV